MAALHEKYLWPLVGIVIFAVLAAFYIDDRRRLAQETQTMTSQETNASTATNYSKQSSTNTSESMPASLESKKTSRHSVGSFAVRNLEYSDSSEDYSTQISSKRNAELIAAAKEHQGFSGSIEDYLSGGKSKQVAASEQPSRDSSKATSMSMDEYLAKAEGKSLRNSNGQQTPMSKAEDDPFQTEEHKGFHGSYEEYANRYN